MTLPNLKIECNLGLMMPGPAFEYFLLPILVAFAAATQRITGIGFALICTPFLILITNDSAYGVLIVNALCAVLNAVVLLQTWKKVQFRSVLILSLAAVLAIPLGQFAVIHMQTDILKIIIGAMILLGLAMLQFRKSLPKLSKLWSPIIAGALSGFMNIIAGVGGPAIALYAAVEDWPQETFVASVQFFFLITNFTSVVVANPSQIESKFFLFLVVCLLAGIGMGSIITKHIKSKYAQTATLAIAALGAFLMVCKGIVGLVGQN